MPLQPALLGRRGPIAAKADGLQLKAQQTQPVAQAPGRDEFPHIGQVWLPPTTKALEGLQLLAAEAQQAGAQLRAVVPVQIRHRSRGAD